MVLGLLDQLQIFVQFYLIELLGLLTYLGLLLPFYLIELLGLLKHLGLLVLEPLIYARLLTGFGMLDFLIAVVIDSFRWFCMGSLHKNIELTLEFVRLQSWSCTFPTIH